MHHYSVCLAVGLSMAGWSCAAIPTGDFGTTIDASGRVTQQQVQASGLRISGKQVSELSSPYFGMLVVTIENTKASWRHIQHVRVSLASPALNQSVVIPAGAELEAWADATLTNSYFALQDVGNVLRRLGLRDWGRRVTEHRGTRERLNEATGLVSISALWANPAAHRTYLPDHLLDAPIAVPPALFAKRWIVLNTPADQTTCIRGFNIELDVQAQSDAITHERVWVPLPDRSSEWQPHFCTQG